MRRLCVLLMGLSPLAATAALEGRVVAVSNGDTVDVLINGRNPVSIHLLGIDAPESSQDFAAQSRTSLAAQTMGKDVRIEDERRVRSGQIVAKVWVADANCRQGDCPKNTDVGLAQIAAGMAWNNPQHGREMPLLDRQRYAEAEFMAKIRRVGLWSGKNPRPPWSWQQRRLDE